MAEDKILDRILDKIDDVQRDVYQVKIDMAEHKILFSEHLDQDRSMADSLDKMEQHLTKLDLHLSEYNRQLDIHIAGVNELKEANRIEREKLSLYKDIVAKDLEDLKKPQIVIKGILWLAGAMLVVGGAIKLFL